MNKNLVLAALVTVVAGGFARGFMPATAPAAPPAKALTEAQRQIELSCTPRIGASAPDPKVCGEGLASIRP